MVENLNFDQNTREYEYDPALYDNFWAALNIGNEPIPRQTAGEVASISVDVEQAIEDYNARYGLAPGDPAYRVYDDQADYFFSIKYFFKAAPFNLKIE